MVSFKSRIFSGLNCRSGPETSPSFNDDLANHACTPVWFAVEVVRSSFAEGFFPGFTWVEGQICVAVFVMALEYSVMGSQLVVDKLDGVACLDADGVRFKRQHSCVSAKFHFDSRCLSGADSEAEQHQERAASSCDFAKEGLH